MYVTKYKHLHNVNFSLTNSSIIYSNDIFVNQDLIELIELVLKGKNPDPQMIKFEDCDSISANKNTKIIVIPSLFDLKKNVFQGTKSLLSILIKEIVLSHKYNNESLNLLQNIIMSFNFNTEFSSLENLTKEIKDLTDIDLQLGLNEVIENYFVDNVVINFFKNEDNIKEEDIGLMNSRIMYFKILELLTMYWDHEVIIIFENPYLGLNYKEIKILNEIIDKITNKIIVLNTNIDIKKDDLINLSIIMNSHSINLSQIINEWHKYEFYLSKKYDHLEFLDDFINKMMSLINLYDDEWTEKVELNKDEQLFWDNLKNQTIF